MTAAMDELREGMHDLFPKLNGGVIYGYKHEGGAVALNAVVRDPSPYSQDDIVYCLEGLGAVVSLPTTEAA